MVTSEDKDVKAEISLFSACILIKRYNIQWCCVAKARQNFMTERTDLWRYPRA